MRPKGYAGRIVKAGKFQVTNGREVWIRLPANPVAVYVEDKGTHYSVTTTPTRECEEVGYYNAAVLLADFIEHVEHAAGELAARQMRTGSVAPRFAMCRLGRAREAA